MGGIGASVLLSCILFLSLISNTLLQAVSPNQVLQLDGRGDYAELPPEVFNDLNEATIEMWVKWKKFGYFSQPFGLGNGEKWRVLAINSDSNRSELRFFIYDELKLYIIRVPDILRRNEWVHIAAVSGEGGMKLYLNGVLVGEREFSGSFATVSRGEWGYLGKPNWRDNEDFKGEIDEVRIWSTRRRGEQIRATMFRRLTGNEPGLVGLWNFDAGDASDSSPRGFHGVLYGDARCAQAELPSSERLKRPAILSGIVTNEQALPLAEASVQLEVRGNLILQTRTDKNGHYRLVFYPPSQPGDLSATRDETGNWQQGIHIEPGEHRSLDLRLRPSVSISGTLLAYDNSLHEGVLVQAEQVQDSGLRGEVPRTRVVASALSDGSGRYRFINLKPGAYRVRCYVGNRYVYYGEEKTGRGEGEQAGKPAGQETIDYPPSAIRHPQQGKALHVQPGQTLTDIDLRFAPFKKGIWRTYTYLDGLAGNRVYAIAKDAAGFLWFGTDGGVSRYDGKIFVNFTSEDGLASNVIRAIEATPDGTLWFGTDGGGLSRYDGHAFRSFTQANGLPDDQIRALHQGPHGTLWIGTEGGLSRYDGQGFTNFTRTDGLPSDRISALCIEPDGTLWIGTEEGLSRYDGKQFINFTAFSGLSSNAVISLHYDGRGVLWIGTLGGVSAYDGEQFIHFTVEDGLPNSKVNAIAEDADGTLWFAGNRGGVCRYDREGWVLFTEQDGLTNNKVEVVYHDPDGLLWFGTRNGGVSCYDSGSFAGFTSQDGLSTWVSAITETAEGELWFGADNGAFRYDGEEFVNVTVQSGLPQYNVYDIYQQSPEGCLWFALRGGGIVRYDGEHFRVFTDEEGLAYMNVNVIRGSPDGKLWIGARARALSQLDTHTFTFRNWTERDGLRDTHIKAIYQDPTGLLWLGSQSAGVIRFDGERFDYLTTEDGLADNSVNTICQTTDGVFWFGTTRGLSRYDGEHFLNLTRKDGLVDDYVTAIHEDADGKLWLGTNSGGVAIYDGVAWSSLDTRDGLLSNAIRSIYEDGAGDLWFGTDDGATRYRRNSYSPRVRLVSVQTDREFSDLSPAPNITRGRRVSLTYRAIDFHTSPEKQQYRIRIRQMNNGRPMANREGGRASFSMTRSTTYDWTPGSSGTYLFEVETINRDLDYSQPASIMLKVVPPWYLNGWLVIPSGTGILALLIIAIVLGHRTYIHRRESQRLRVQLLEQEREKNIQLQAAKEKAESAREAAELANQAKSVFLANMSHEIRTPLNAVLGYAQLLQRDSDLPVKQRSAVETIEESGNHLLALINDVLDISKIEAGRLELHASDFDLTQLIKGLSVMFELRCQHKQLKWIADFRLLSADREHSALSTQHPVLVHGDEGKLRQVLLNLLANAVKFTDSGEVILRITNHEVRSAKCDSAFRFPSSTFYFEVLDTGIGIPAEEQTAIFAPFQQGESGFQAGGTGLGLAIAQRYVTLMGGLLHVESEVGKGSRFFFSLALPQAAPGHVVDSGHDVVCLTEGTHVKALVADDVPENRDILAQMLLDIGVCVQTASDGGDALEIILEDRPDIVFLDIRMPVMDGFRVVHEVLARKEADANYSPPKLVAVSASAMIHQREEYREAGFDDFLAKPVRSEEVYECLAQLLHIEYEMDEDSDLSLDFSTLVLPEPLLQRLWESAELGRVTELEKSLPELRESGEAGARLAEHLGELSRNLDMEQILDLLGAIHSERKPDG